MSIGSIVGGVLGAIVGWIVGGPYGAAVGFVVGFGLGMVVDPMSADVSQAGVPIQQLQMPDNTIGAVIPDVLGTAKIAGTFLCFGQEKAVPQYTQSSGGKGGDSGSSQVTGYKYYMSWAQGICLGPVDKLYAIYKNNDELIWSGELERPESGGKETIALPEYGSIIFYFGTDDQAADATVGAIIGDATLNSPLRGLCYAVMKNFYIGEYNRCPALKFVLKKTTAIEALPGNNTIGGYDYNPAHALWYIFNNMVGLPVEWLHEDSFADVAATLKSEGLGVSICFDQYQTALTYLEAINTHVDNIIKYGSDGKFHLKLIRADYNAAQLPLIDENIILEDPQLTRKSWIDTINEIKVQYSEIYGVEAGNEESYAKGYFGGARDNDGHYQAIEALQFSNETVAALAAVLSEERQYIMGGVSSMLKGYFGGGFFGDEGPIAGWYKRVIDALRFSDETVAALAALLSEGYYDGGAVNSTTNGYFAAGEAYRSGQFIYNSFINALQFSTESIRLVQEELISYAQAGMANVSSTLKGYFAGGWGGPSEAHGNKIESLQFSTEITTLLGTVLSQYRYRPAGVSSTLKGYIGGGYIQGTYPLESIEALQFSNETVATLSAVLSVARYGVGGVSSTLKGYFGGGATAASPGGARIVDALQFSDETLVSLGEALTGHDYELAGVRSPA